MVGSRTLILVVCLSGIACASGGEDSADSDYVAGAYVHAYTADVIDPETGEVMGTRTVRDTIFIKAVGDSYEIANRKWLMNDYDNEGWVTEMSDADKATPTYITKYDAAKKKLIPTQANKFPPFYLGDDKIYWGEEKALEYTKVDE
jgi:hypothetical protein